MNIYIRNAKKHLKFQKYVPPSGIKSPHTHLTYFI